jgi:hypothetical protein
MHAEIQKQLFGTVCLIALRNPCSASPENTSIYPRSTYTFHPSQTLGTAHTVMGGYRLTGHGYIAMVPKLLAGVAVGTENGNASHASSPAPARPTVTVSNWPPAIGDANTGVPAGTGFTT